MVQAMIDGRMVVDDSRAPVPQGYKAGKSLYTANGSNDPGKE